MKNYRSGNVTVDKLRNKLVCRNSTIGTILILFILVYVSAEVIQITPEWVFNLKYSAGDFTSFNVAVHSDLYWNESRDIIGIRIKSSVLNNCWELVYGN